MTEIQIHEIAQYVKEIGELKAKLAAAERERDAYRDGWDILDKMVSERNDRIYSLEAEVERLRQEKSLSGAKWGKVEVRPVFPITNDDEDET